MPEEIYVSIRHDFMRGFTAVEYLTEADGNPILVGELRPLCSVLELSSDLERFRFLSKFDLKDKAIKVCSVAGISQN